MSKAVHPATGSSDECVSLLGWGVANPVINRRCNCSLAFPFCPALPAPLFEHSLPGLCQSHSLQESLFQPLFLKKKH